MYVDACSRNRGRYPHLRSMSPICRPVTGGVWFDGYINTLLKCYASTQANMDTLTAPWASSKMQH